MNRIYTTFLVLFVALIFATASLAQKVITEKGTPLADTNRVLKKSDSLSVPKYGPPRFKTRQNSSLIPIDSNNIIPKTYTYIVTDSVKTYPSISLAEIQPTNERSNGDLWDDIPGIYPLNLGFFGQQLVAMSPLDPAGLRTEIWGRDNGDPIRGWTPAELIQTRGILRTSGGPFAIGGDKISIEPIITRPRRAMMTIDYRDGYYALGRVDWRFFNPITKSDLWGVGVGVNQANGRYTGTGISTLSLFAHYRHEPLGAPALIINARQHTDSVGFAGTEYYKESNRYDIDVIVKKGEPKPDTTRDTIVAKAHADSLWREYWKSDWSIQGYWTKALSHTVTFPQEDGRRLGTIGKYRVLVGTSEFSSFIRMDELRALVSEGGRIVQPQGEIGAGYTIGNEFKPSVSLSVEGATGYNVQPKGLLSLTLQVDSSKSLTGWASRTVRFPTIAERVGVFDQPWFERFFEPLLYTQLTTYPYIGNRDLSPIQLIKGGFQLNWKPSERFVFNVYGTSVHEANPILTNLVKIDSANYKYQPGNNSALSYRMSGLTIQAHPFGWGIFNVVGTAVQYDGYKPYFMPTQWGHCDVGATDSWHHEAFRWQALVRFHYIGERNWITPYQYYTESPVMPVDVLLAVKIYSFRFNWGVGNFFKKDYEAMPGYPAMHHEEQWGVNWTIWD